MDYETLATFSKSWGLVYMVVLFAAVCLYALRPRNKATFDKAARVPLEGDDN
jgi:cytochrome c oxidase cbb3-type subunit 4